MAALMPIHAEIAAPRPQSGGLSGEALTWATYRYRVIEPLLSGAWQALLGAERDGIVIQSREDFIAMLAGTEWVKPNGQKETFARGSIFRLIKRFKSGGLAALARADRSDRGRQDLTVPEADFLRAAYCSGGSAAQPALRSVREVMRIYEDERQKRELLHSQGVLSDYIHGRGDFAEISQAFRQILDDAGNEQAPDYYLFRPRSYNTIHRFCAAIPEPLKVLARAGEKRYRAVCEPVIHRDYAGLRPMQYVVFDHRRCDLFVILRKNGRDVLMRPWETVALDMKSRMVIASVMCESPSALTVASCVRQAILRIGLFETAHIDNGKEFTASYIDGDGHKEGESWKQDFDGREFEVTRGILKRLGISTIHALPYNARAKCIEPSFRNPAWFERTLPGACGNRTPNRPEFLAKWEKEFKRHDPAAVGSNHPFYSFAQFRELKEHFYFEIYNKRPHTGRAMEGRSPDQVMRQECLDAGLARTVNPRELDLLLQKRRMRTVGQGGAIVACFSGADYIYRDLALHAWQGREIETSYDPYDLGEMNCYEPGAAYICTAKCLPLRGMGERELAEPIKEQARLRREIKRSLRDIHHFASMPTPEERMQWHRLLNGAAVPRPPAIPAAAALPAAGEDAAPADDLQLTFMGSEI